MTVKLFAFSKKAQSVMRRYYVGIASVFLTAALMPIKVNGSAPLTHINQYKNKSLKPAIRMGANQ